MLEEFRKLKTDAASLRRFGYWIGGVALVLGGLLVWKGAGWAWGLLAAGAVLVAGGALAPGALRQVYRAWMFLGMLLGTVVSTLVLVVFFYLMVTPYALLLRLIGKDFLGRKAGPGAGSYWQPRRKKAGADPANYERQF